MCIEINYQDIKKNPAQRRDHSTQVNNNYLFSFFIIISELVVESLISFPPPFNL